MACQIPLRSGLPSAVRGARYAAGACPDTGVATAAMNAPPAAAMAAMMTVLNVLRTWDTPPAGVNPRRILIDCQYFTVDTHLVRAEYHAGTTSAVPRPDLSHREEAPPMRRCAVAACVLAVVTL